MEANKIASICDYDEKSEELICNLIKPFQENGNEPLKMHQNKSYHQLFEKSEEPLVDIKTVLKNQEIEIAVTGNAFNYFSEKASIFEFHEILHRSKVFARMKPNQKAFLVDSLKDQNYSVGKIKTNLPFYFL